MLKRLIKDQLFLAFVIIILFSWTLYCAFLIGKSTIPVIETRNYEEITIIPTVSVIPTGKINSNDIEKEFIDANFRVIKVAKHPIAPYYLIVATKRERDIECGSGNQRCGNDTACGSVNLIGSCYFFVEPDFVSGADGKTRFLGKLDYPFGGFRTDTEFTFPDKFHANFRSVLNGKSQLWQVNIYDGGIVQLDK